MMSRSRDDSRGQLALVVLCAVTLAAGVAGRASAADTHDAPDTITLPGAHAFPESITSTADGTVYIGSLGEGGVLRAAAGAGRASAWVRPGAHGSHSVFGVLADEQSGALWACSNDLTARGIVVGPGNRAASAAAAAATPAAPPDTATPGATTSDPPDAAAPDAKPAATGGATEESGSALLSFDLKTGHARMSVPLPGKNAFCNDLVIGPDGAAYVTNMLAGQILRLKKGAKAFEVWSADPQFLADGAGSLDGLAFGGDGNLYVDTYTTNKLYRVRVKNGVAGKVTQLTTSRALKNPDALRLIAGDSFVLIEGAGRLDRVTVSGDHAVVDTIQDGYSVPTGVTLQSGKAWVSEGQLNYVFDPAQKGKTPRLPFKAYAVDVVQ
jgi:sugar lactone lactonase YvrE